VKRLPFIAPALDFQSRSEAFESNSAGRQGASHVIDSKHAPGRTLFGPTSYGGCRAENASRFTRWPQEGVVPLISSIAELLKRERIPYTCFRHVPSYTAQEEAAVSHIQEACWA